MVVRERLVQFTPRKIKKLLVPQASVVEIRPKPAIPQTLPDWIGDESNGWSKAEFEERIAKKRIYQKKTPSQLDEAIVDVSEMPDKVFEFFLSQLKKGVK